MEIVVAGAFILVGILIFQIFDRLKDLKNQNFRIQGHIKNTEENFKKRIDEIGKEEDIFVDLEFELKSLKNGMHTRSIIETYSIQCNNEYAIATDLDLDLHLFQITGDFPNLGMKVSDENITVSNLSSKTEKTYEYNDLGTLVKENIFIYDETNELIDNEIKEYKIDESGLYEECTKIKNNQLNSIHKTQKNNNGNKLVRIEEEKNDEYKSGKTCFNYSSNGLLAVESFYEVNNKDYKDESSFRIDYYYTSRKKLLKEIHSNPIGEEYEMVKTTLYAYKDDDNRELISILLAMPSELRNIMLSTLAIYSKQDVDFIFNIHNETDIKIDVIKEIEEE
jgi:hypothetical protein